MYVIPITDPTMNPARRVPVISLMNLIDHQFSLLLYNRKQYEDVRLEGTISARPVHVLSISRGSHGNAHLF